MTLSTDPAAPLVAIVGITGKQGGSVARALIESDKPYRIRGLTRDASKPAAQAFAGKGVELRSVSLSVGNEDSVRAAFKGADIVFVSRLLQFVASNAWVLSILGRNQLQ